MNNYVKVAKLHDNAEKQIFPELEGFIFTHTWAQDHVLEIKFEDDADYRTAVRIMEMECPTEAQSMFGVRSELMLVFQFDLVDNKKAVWKDLN